MPTANKFKNTDNNLTFDINVRSDTGCYLLSFKIRNFWSFLKLVVQNVRKKMQCYQTTKHILPAFGLVFLLCWSYYAYVVILCIFTVKLIIKKFIFLVIYHMLFIITMVSYFAAMFVTKATVPADYKLEIADYELYQILNTDDDRNELLEQFCQSRNIVVQTVTSSGGIR